jgi:hypothetical protein
VQLADADGDTKVMVEESSDEDTIRMDIAGTEVLTLTNSAMTLKGTTPTLTIGDGGEEDTKIVFDGNAQDYYIGLDDSADDLIIGKGSAVGTTPAIVIDENLNVGIGCTDPQTPLEIDTSTANYRIQFTHTSGQNLIKSIDSDHSTMRSLFYDAADHVYQISGTERMRIDSSGALLMGTTSQITSTSEEVLHIENGDGVGQIVLNNTRSSGNQYMIQIRRLGTLVGSIQATTTATSYVTSSDYRLKENLDYTWDATTRLKQLKPARFNFKSDETNTLVDGFLAHEVSDIVPEAITGEKDAVDSEGNPEYQGIDQSKLVPLLVKTIQELEARITTLEGS